MKSVMSEHQFEKLAEYSDGAAYRVLVKINMNLGWIENVKCCIENLRQKQMFQMKYKCQEDDFACFELYINLPTQAVFYYYFFKRICAEGQRFHPIQYQLSSELLPESRYIVHTNPMQSVQYQ